MLDGHSFHNGELPPRKGKASRSRTPSVAFCYHRSHKPEKYNCGQVCTTYSTSSRKHSKFMYHYTKPDVLVEKILPTEQIRFSRFAKTNDPSESKDWTLGILIAAR
jgi:hypothetical protein